MYGGPVNKEHSTKLIFCFETERVQLLGCERSRGVVLSIHCVEFLFHSAKLSIFSDGNLNAETPVEGVGSESAKYISLELLSLVTLRLGALFQFREDGQWYALDRWY